jgi:hypothetical protein
MVVLEERAAFVCRLRDSFTKYQNLIRRAIRNYNLIMIYDARKDVRILSRKE